MEIMRDRLRPGQDALRKLHIAAAMEALYTIANRNTFILDGREEPDTPMLRLGFYLFVDMFDDDEWEHEVNELFARVEREGRQF
jgi:hypothetical protein